MGWASFTAFMVAAVQKLVDGSLQPIENSPPGIQTMLLGALLGRGRWLGTVGAKADPPPPGAPSSAEIVGKRQTMLKRTRVKVPKKKGVVMWGFLKGFDSRRKTTQPARRATGVSRFVGPAGLGRLYRSKPFP